MKGKNDQPNKRHSFKNTTICRGQSHEQPRQKQKEHMKVPAIRQVVKKIYQSARRHF